MNCERCSTPMVWSGSATRGSLDCPKCRQERKNFFDLGKARQIGNSWFIPTIEMPQGFLEVKEYEEPNE